MAKDKTHKRWHSDYSMLFNRAASKLCMAGSNCQPSVKCHSISVGRVLQRIAEDGKVVAVAPSETPGNSTLRLQGVSQVSTFSGFCAKHDQKLFATIDNFDYQHGNPEQEFLFSYRTIARYYYYKLAWCYAQEAKLAAYIDVRTKDEQLHSVGLNRRLTNDEVDRLIGLQEQAVKDAISSSDSLKSLMGALSDAIARDDYIMIATRVVELPREYPVAQSGSLIVDGTSAEGYPHMITVNVIPQHGRTYALLSCTVGHGTSCVDDHLERFRIKGELDYHAAITHIMCMTGDPIAIRPSYWEALSDDLKIDFIERLNLWMSGGVDPVRREGLFNILINTK